MNTPVLSLDMKDPLHFIDTHGSFAVVKVGHNLAVNGKGIISALADRGLKVILDLKFVDIPSTIERSIKSWDHEAIIGFTVHSASGLEAMKAARQATDKHVFAVVKLTSIPGTLEDYMDTIQKLYEIELDFVLPGQWAIALRDKLKDAAFLVPGIRMEIPAGDQKDVVSVEDVKCIADYLVIGREVYLSENPRVKMQKIKDSLGVGRDGYGNCY
ncbi:orotidine-5'-phosphate decarboxylase [bacterium 3DAC]|nr:orotidine-5'-phosphate decarboxylase [bacterium 3DAC]